MNNSNGNGNSNRRGIVALSALRQALVAAPIAASLSKAGDRRVPNHPGARFRQDALGINPPVIGPYGAFAPSDPLTVGDGYDPITALASQRIAPAWFPYGGGEIRQGTDYTNAGTFKQLLAAAEGLSLQGDGRRIIGVNTTAADVTTATFDFDSTALSIGFLVRFGTTGTNVNPLAGQELRVASGDWVTPWTQSTAANAARTSPDRDVVVSLDVDGLGKPLFVPWATENFQRVRTVLALPGIFADQVGVDPVVRCSFPTGLAAISPMQVELVTADHPDLDRIVEQMAAMLMSVEG